MAIEGFRPVLTKLIPHPPAPGGDLPWETFSPPGNVRESARQLVKRFSTDEAQALIRAAKKKVRGAPNEVLLTTESAIKKEAYSLGLEGFFQGAKILIIASRPDSRIPEQPFGYTQTVLGGLNRLDLAELQFQGSEHDFRFKLSIESGCLPAFLSGAVRFMDVAFIVVKTQKSSTPMITMSGGVEFPPEYAIRAINDNPDRRTIGWHMSKALDNPALDKDPHRFLLGHWLDGDDPVRSLILHQATEVALARAILES